MNLHDLHEEMTRTKGGMKVSDFLMEAEACPNKSARLVTICPHCNNALVIQRFIAIAPEPE